MFMSVGIAHNRQKDPLAARAAGASVPRVSAGSEARGCVEKQSGAPGWAPPGTWSPANPAPGGTRSAGSPGPFVTPKPAATRRIAALGVARSLFSPARVWRRRGAAQTGAAEPGFPKRCPGSLGNRTRGGGARLCVVRAVLRERAAAAQAPRVANQTKSKRKSARVCRLATHGSQDPRCTPFFGGKGGGRGREGVAGEGSYLRFNCRWRLRLFQDRQSAPKNYTHTQKKNSKGACKLERSAALPKKKKKKARAGQSRGAGRAQVPQVPQPPGLARRAELSTGACCSRAPALRVFLRAEPGERAGARTERRAPVSPARASGIVRAPGEDAPPWLGPPAAASPSRRRAGARLGTTGSRSSVSP